MKRLALSFLLVMLTICFTHAPVHALQITKIPLSSVGQKIKTIPASTAQEASMNLAFLGSAGSYKMIGDFLTVALSCYSAPLGIAASFGLGYVYDALFNTQQAYNAHMLQQDAGLNGVIASTFPTSSTYPTPTDTFSSNCGNIKLSGNVVPPVSGCTGGGWLSSSTPAVEFSCSNKTAYYHFKQPVCGEANGVAFYKTQAIPFTISQDQANWPLTGPPDQLTDARAAQLAQALANAVANSPALRDALDNVIKNNPSLVQSPSSPITQQQIQNWANTNNYNTTQNYIDYLTNLANTYEGDTTSINNELERAKAEQEKEQADDIADTSYSPIASSGFATPYNPGTYNIPQRFTTFMNRVKSTGLFSFSTSFFNSLPGGGDPTYTIHGGETFGTHTIDLSQTMGGGLAVIKTVLLAVFGFLSIRAIIMKR